MLKNLNDKNTSKIDYSFFIQFIAILIIHQIIFQKFFPNANGFIGHDYEYFIPHLMFGKLWFSKNFLSIPWFSPSFCCGVPFYSDPETMYYSINQIIFLFFKPSVAIKIIFFILSFTAYLGMFLLVKKNFKLNKYTSLLCASLFLFNGFFVYRAIQGHVSHLSFVFIPLYCYFLISGFKSQEKKYSLVYLILSSIVFANFFHSGSGPIIFGIFGSIVSLLLFYSHLVKNLKIFINFIFSLFIGILISLSKISAVLFFLNNFSRKYPMMHFDSITSYIKTFFLSFFLTPDEKYFNDSITSMFPLGLHEIEYGMSIVPIILLFCIFFINKRIFQKNFRNIIFIFLVASIFFVPVLLNVNFLNQFDLIKKIPILNSSWVQVRWMIIYILPIIILSGYIIENLNSNFINKKYLSIILIFILLAQNYIRDKSWHFDKQEYNLKNASDFSLILKKNKAQEILGPGILMNEFGSPKKLNNKNDMFFFSYSPLLCYHGVFGYGLEALNAKKITFNSKTIFQDNSYMIFSNKFDEKNGNYMFFNPSCFLFPEANNCLPGDTFKTSEKEKLIKFTTYKKFDFEKNKLQTISNYISILTFISCLLYLIYIFVIFIYNLRKNTNSSGQ